MTNSLSPNTKAILLLTAPLIAGRSKTSVKPLSLGQYQKLAKKLRELERQPADLISGDATNILSACQDIIDTSQVQQLLDRGLLLCQAVENWHARAIQVISRADADYPRKLKSLLKEYAPPILYVCGDIQTLDKGGLAIVGSRHANDTLIDYTRAVGQLAAQAGKTVISGNAKGVDQAAMISALDAGGHVIGITADSLIKAVVKREYRNHLMAGKLVLLSPFDPSAGFHQGLAMQRNKFIYAFADTSLVVNADLEKGGTWTGAVEQLEKLRFVPVFVRSSGSSSPGLDALKAKGAIPWPNPKDAESFLQVFTIGTGDQKQTSQAELAMLNQPTAESVTNSIDSRAESKLNTTISVDKEIAPDFKTEQNAETPLVATDNATLRGVESLSQAKKIERPQLSGADSLSKEAHPSEQLYVAVRNIVLALLKTPHKDSEVASALDVTTKQAKAWLEKLVQDNAIERQNRPVVYQVKEPDLFYKNEIGLERPESREDSHE